jgi:hypothetical protein
MCRPRKRENGALHKTLASDAFLNLSILKLEATQMALNSISTKNRRRLGDCKVCKRLCVAVDRQNLCLPCKDQLRIGQKVSR